MKILNETCSNCNLCISNNFKPIKSKGNIYSKLLIVGEAPGAKERNLNLPFVGKSGEKLQEYLDKYSLSNHCFITNAVNCRPPKNRVPNMNEILSCRYRLTYHIEIIKPIIILLLGNTAINSYFQAEVNNISKFNNKTFIYNNTIIMFGYHPSYILRNEEYNTLYDILFNNLKIIYKHYVNPYIL